MDISPILAGIAIGIYCAIANPAKCAETDQYEDFSALSTAKDLVSRSGDTLILKTGDSSLQLIDGTCPKIPENKTCSYRFIKYEKEFGYYIVHAYYDNEFDSIMVIKYSNGTVINVPDIPNFSPNRTFFIVVRSCEQMGDFCGIQVWDARNLKLIWEHRPSEYAVYEFGRWDGNRKVQLKVTTWINHKFVTTDATLSSSASRGWQLNGPHEQSK